MRLLQKIVIFTVFLSATLYADWKPDEIEENSASLNSLKEHAFVSLKNQVSKEVANSWCSSEKVNLLMDLVALKRPKVCVEIGVFTGSSLLPIASTLKYFKCGKVYAIDAWSNSEATKNLANDDPNKPWWSQVDMGAVHNSFKSLISKFSLGSYCTEIHKSSENAISDIPANIDFLHLDGDYSEIGTLRDVELYLPKVKSGGYILLSNFFIIVNREQPKIAAFCNLCDVCEIVASIENDNAVLFRKK